LRYHPQRGLMARVRDFERVESAGEIREPGRDFVARSKIEAVGQPDERVESAGSHAFEQRRQETRKHGGNRRLLEFRREKRGGGHERALLAKLSFPGGGIDRSSCLGPRLWNPRAAGRGRIESGGSRTHSEQRDQYHRQVHAEPAAVHCSAASVISKQSRQCCPSLPFTTADVVRCHQSSSVACISSISAASFARKRNWRTSPRAASKGPS